jgi:predicted dehydrogenase
MNTKWSRRELLKNLTLSASALPLSTLNFDGDGRYISLLKDEHAFVPGKPISVITLGAGNRGNVYGNFSIKYPEKMDIVGVAEPNKIRQERYATKHNISTQNIFNTWEDVFKKPKFADAVIISTPDYLHFGPCIAALEKGYDILLEKPISPSEKECRQILALARKTGRIVAVCHVLRYSPYFKKLRELMHDGTIGEVVSMQHLEPIGNVHMSHSFVRGNWHNSAATNPIILAKSCHDLDIIKWMIDKPCKNIQAFGDLKWFKKENAPAGSTARCTDGCAAEATCPYSAIKIYHKDRQRLHVFDMPENNEQHSEHIMQKLRTTDYGRCVYRMDNDQPDHYIANMLFKDNVTASFSMEALTSYEGRRTRVMGSKGDIVGDMESFVVTDFLTGKQTTWKQDETDMHGGGDWHLVEDWLVAIDKQNPSLLSSTIDASVESHLMGFAAEKSRKQLKVVSIV